MIELLKEHGCPPMCRFGNDNPYGLMFALSYIYRFGLYALLDLHMLDSRLREKDYMLIKAKCELINTQDNGQVKICRIVPFPCWCMGEQYVSIHQAERNQERWSNLRRSRLHHPAQVDYAQGKGMTLIYFLFYRSHDVS